MLGLNARVVSESFLVSVIGVLLGCAVLAVFSGCRSTAMAEAQPAFVVTEVAGTPTLAERTGPVAKSEPTPEPVSVLAKAEVAKADCPCGDACPCKSGHRIGDRVQHPGGYYELEWVWHPATARPATSAAGASPVRPTVPSPVAAPQGWVCEGGTCRYVGPQRSGRLGGRLFVR